MNCHDEQKNNHIPVHCTREIYGLEYISILVLINLLGALRFSNIKGVKFLHIFANDLSYISVVLTLTYFSL